MKRWYEPRKDTPGIAKDAPRKKGLALFLEILWREFWALLKLNVLFLLSCIPIVTIPAAITAMSRITVSMVRDKNFFLLSDYWKAFRRDFGKSLLAGILLAVGFGLFGLSTWFYHMLSQSSGVLFLILAGCSLCLLLTVYFISLYFFPMLAMVDLPLKPLLINSCVLSYTCFKRTLPAAVITLLISLLCVGLLPYSMVYIVVILFSLNSLIANFFIVKPITEQVLGIKEPEAPQNTAAPTEEAEEAAEEAFPEWEAEEGES